MGLHVGLTTSGLVTSDTSLSIEDLLQMNRRHVALPLEHVYYSPTRPNLFSQSVSREQSFNVDYDDEKATYPLSKNLATALQAPLKSKCGLWMFTAHNEFLPGENNPLVPDPMHIRKMDDEGLVEGVMLRRRQLNMCEACQIGKQRAKAGGAQ
ncbi:hypothetical protein PC119_g18121 [Phytophthora cactorum]|uniref:GAG-pre-integrase domain-containing protein n=1 Tax=Phytophthora cactorum TaxID=29920 RepID=A0A8T1AVC4_9STRA|nr:hypothetical protein PC117_g25066 [Phytophthora cactorum]KAG2995209.1 hypothetical protein PC119_g18121 [Phytophthora cactorum]